MDDSEFITSNKDSQCSVRDLCRNNGIKCWICRADNEGYDDLFYKPTDSPKAPKRHPLVEAERLANKLEIKAETLAKKAANKAVKSKQTMAMLIEKKAHKIADTVMAKQIKRDFSSPTINSGRANRDVDHTMHKGQIRLDSKHQSKLVHHKVRLNELDEARYKAEKFRSDLGGLILWNAEERSVVVFDYGDWLMWESSRDTNISEDKG